MKQSTTIFSEPTNVLERRRKHQQIFSTALLFAVPLSLAVVWGALSGTLPVWWPLYLPLLGLILAGVWERRRSQSLRYELALVALLCANGAAINVLRLLSKSGQGVFADQSLLLVAAGIFLFQRPRWVWPTLLPYAALHLGVGAVIAQREHSPERWMTLLVLITTLAMYSMLYLYRSWWEQAHESQRVYQELAYTDDLTTLPNRRALQERWLTYPNTLLEQIGDSTAVMMVDIDHFKRVNDQYGHAEGDRLLWLVGQLIYGQLGISPRPKTPQPAVGRWGGEEFLVMVPLTSPTLAYMLAESIRGSIEHADAAVTLTVSIGLAFREGSETLAETAARADAALYRAKQSGRNRVVLLEDDFLDETEDLLLGQFRPADLIPNEFNAV